MWKGIAVSRQGYFSLLAAVSVSDLLAVMTITAPALRLRLARSQSGVAENVPHRHTYISTPIMRVTYKPPRDDSSVVVVVSSKPTK